MDFLRLGGDCAISLAQDGAGFAEAISLLGLPLGSGTVRSGSFGINYKYLDPAAGPVVHRPAVDTGGAAFLQNVGAAREIRFCGVHAIVFACGIRDLKRTCSFVSDHNFGMKDFCQRLNAGH